MTSERSSSNRFGGMEKSVPPRNSDLLYLIYRFRYLLHAVLYGLGFVITSVLTGGALSQRVWLALPAFLTRHLRMDLGVSAMCVTSLAAGLAFAGAILRTWGTAYAGADAFAYSVNSNRMLRVGGLYRLLRDPRHVGTVLHTLAIAVLMSPVGALFVIASIVVLQIVLIAAEERRFGKMYGESYLAYQHQVPARGRWGQAFLREIYVWGVFVSFAVLGWRYNAVLVIQGILVSLGLSIVLRGVLKR